MPASCRGVSSQSLTGTWRGRAYARNRSPRNRFCGCSLSSFQFPSLAVLAREIPVRLGQVGDLSLSEVARPDGGKLPRACRRNPSLAHGADAPMPGTVRPDIVSTDVL